MGKLFEYPNKTVLDGTDEFILSRDGTEEFNATVETVVDHVNTALDVASKTDATSIVETAIAAHEDATTGWDHSSFLTAGTIPAIAISETYVVGTIAERDALVIGDNLGEVQVGDVSVVNDTTAGTYDSYIYDSTAWVALTQFVGTLGQLQDVEIAGAVATEVLTYDGTNWVSAAPLGVEILGIDSRADDATIGEFPIGLSVMESVTGLFADSTQVGTVDTVNIDATHGYQEYTVEDNDGRYIRNWNDGTASTEYPTDDLFDQTAGSDPDSTRWSASFVDNTNLYEDGSGNLVLQGWTLTGNGINSNYYYDSSSNWEWKAKINGFTPGGGDSDLTRMRVGISSNSTITEVFASQWADVPGEVMHTDIRVTQGSGLLNVQHELGGSATNLVLPVTIQYVYNAGTLTINAIDGTAGVNFLYSYGAWAAPSEAHMFILQSDSNTETEWAEVLDVTGNAQGLPGSPGTSAGWTSWTKYIDETGVNDLITAVGHTHDQGLDTTDAPTFAGIEGLSKSPTQLDNIMLGINAGNSTIGDRDNIFIGEGVGANLGSPRENVLIGPSACSDATGDIWRNICIGRFAGNSLDGEYNILHGYRAGESLLGSDYNVFIGSYANRNGTLIDDSIAIGRDVLYNTNGSKNIAIGYQAGYNLTDGTNVIIIGNDITLIADTTASDIIIIGDANQKVGIGGNNNPQYSLDATGDINITGDYYLDGTAVPVLPFDATDGQIAVKQSGDWVSGTLTVYQTVIPVQDTPPAGASEGDLWIDTST